MDIEKICGKLEIQVSRDTTSIWAIFSSTDGLCVSSQPQPTTYRGEIKSNLIKTYRTYRVYDVHREIATFVHGIPVDIL